MKVGIACVAIGGGWYPKGAARLLASVEKHSPAVQVSLWVNTYPCGTGPFIVDGYDYGPYTAKPVALASLRGAGCDVGLVVDAAFYAVRPLDPLIEHIVNTGYYLCRNGFKVGEWASDACLERMGVSREKAFGMEEASSYCVGVDFRNDAGAALAETWSALAEPQNRALFAGPHTAGIEGRNPGFVSTDPRVKGHRHDQTVLSIVANDLGCTEMVERPRFTAYAAGYGGFPDDSTVLVNEGGFA